MKTWDIRFYGYSETGRFETKVVVKAETMDEAKEKAEQLIDKQRLYHCTTI